MSKPSPFRVWLQNIWFDNCSEHAEFREPQLTMAEYFQRYKWWLRREFRHQTRR